MTAKKSNGNGVQAGRFPDEVLDRIFTAVALWRPIAYYKRFYQPSRLINSLLVCKSWFRRAQIVLFRYVSFHRPYSERSFLQALNAHAVAGRRFQIRAIQMRDSYEDEADLIYATRALISIVFYANTHLRTLAMGDFAASELDELVLSLSTLENLQYLIADGLELSTILSLCSNCFKNLRDITISKAAFEQPFPPSGLQRFPSSLKSLGLHTPVDDFGDDDFKFLIELASDKLTQLSLWEVCQHVSGEAVAAALKHLGPQLETLEISTVTLLLPYAHILEPLSKLRSLEMGVDNDLHCACKLNLPNGLRYLCIFDLPSQPEMSCLKKILDGLPQLRTLCLVASSGLEPFKDHHALIEYCRTREIMYRPYFLHEENKPSEWYDNGIEEIDAKRHQLSVGGKAF